ncbi:hypothetical protein SAMN05216417_11711 [Nitrosospira multiformis]|uniref:Uncharacterized protein n=1 Tax=Nitrosospira multiformis TaxID=1231 RepID=A0A1I7IBI8_9PROT|nr:hypothetical protein SAMN05216417_11711 [Nitrosospira multiformis]
MSMTKMPGFTAEFAVKHQFATRVSTVISTLQLDYSQQKRSPKRSLNKLDTAQSWAGYQRAALLNYAHFRNADMTPGTPAINPRTRRN